VNELIKEAKEFLARTSLPKSEGAKLVKRLVEALEYEIKNQPPPYYGASG
jgi:hypothetical protein